MEKREPILTLSKKADGNFDLDELAAAIRTMHEREELPPEVLANPSVQAQRRAVEIHVAAKVFAAGECNLGTDPEVLTSAIGAVLGDIASSYLSGFRHPEAFRYMTNVFRVAFMAAASGVGSVQSEIKPAN